MAKDESYENLPPFTPTSTSVGIVKQDDSSYASFEQCHRFDDEREPLLHEVDDAENYKKTTHSSSGSEGWRNPFSTSSSVGGSRLKRFPPHY